MMKFKQKYYVIPLKYTPGHNLSVDTVGALKNRLFTDCEKYLQATNLLLI